ncbi:MAG: hypothetical protein KF906_07740 [Actinobacteria bacterium]|nr:hypothetical protein [Actinomycetota bacterium]
MNLDPLDELPIHQVPLSFAAVGTSDHNFYDRCIYQAVAHDGSTTVLTGLGVYPNLGVIDAFAAVRRGEREWAVQTSGTRPADRTAQAVGPYRIEVVEPFRQLHLTCDGDEHGVGFDLWFESEYEPMREPQHFRYGGPTDRVLIEGCRFAQLGTWRGELRVDGQTIDVQPSSWTATRDRSWGIRPVGEAGPQGRPDARPTTVWYCWVPLRFEDFGVHLMVEEDADGFRTLNYAVRVWPGPTGRRMEQLGWPEIDIRYRPGTRFPEGATIRCTTVDRRDLEIELDCTTAIPLHVGPGYLPADDWSHGMWMGEEWTTGRTYDFGDPDVRAKLPWGSIDHLASARCDGQQGFGIFEHASVGRHAPTGMDDYFSVAP